MYIYIFIGHIKRGQMVSNRRQLKTIMKTGIEATRMRESADKACQLVKTLANPNRLMLLCHLSQAESCVGELESLVEIEQPTLSQQLTVLRKEGLVKTRREGKQIYYSLSSEVAVLVMGLLYKHYCFK